MDDLEPLSSLIVLEVYITCDIVIVLVVEGVSANELTQDIPYLIGLQVAPPSTLPCVHDRCGRSSIPVLVCITPTHFLQ